MVDLLRFAREAEAGEYICADCGYMLVMQGGGILPICPAHGRERHVKKGWRMLLDRIGPEPEQAFEMRP